MWHTGWEYFLCYCNVHTWHCIYVIPSSASFSNSLLDFWIAFFCSEYMHCSVHVYTPGLELETVLKTANQTKTVHYLPPKCSNSSLYYPYVIVPLTEEIIGYIHHTHARTCTRTGTQVHMHTCIHAHAHTHAHAHAHTCTCTHTRTHTLIPYSIKFSSHF